jgi:hypothetical protein
MNGFMSHPCGQFPPSHKMLYVDPGWSRAAAANWIDSIEWPAVTDAMEEAAHRDATRSLW